MTKQLQQDSKYNAFDADGDGIVSDEELALSERMLQIENNDKMQDQQRLMAWVAMLSSIVTVFALLTPYIAIERMDTASAFLTVPSLSVPSPALVGTIAMPTTIGKNPTTDLGLGACVRYLLVKLSRARLPFSETWEV